MLLHGDPGDVVANEGIRLETKRRRQIPNDVGLQRPPEAMRAARELMSELQPNAVMRSLSSVYNCMGLPFSSRRTTIDTRYLSMILKDDGYQQISEYNVEIGDLVVYKDALDEVTHIGIVQAKTPHVSSRPDIPNLYVLSQWGRDGEYLHRIDQVPPSYGVAQEYWTDRYDPQ